MATVKAVVKEGDGHLYNGNGQRLDITLSRRNPVPNRIIEANGVKIIVPAGAPSSRAAAEHSK